MLPCFSDRRRVSPLDGGLLGDNSSYCDMSQTTRSKTTDERSSDQSKGICISGLSNDPKDYEVYQSVGVGFQGQASILITKYKPIELFTVVRHINLEALSMEQIEEVQNEMKLSQLLSHYNIACYLANFVAGSHLWAVQPLMHYGSCADIMHSAQPFRNGFKESVIAIILRDVVQGLEYLHNLGYVHRSVRAKHFLIHKDGVVKLSGLRSVVPMIEDGSRLKALHGHFSNTVENICWLAPEVLAQDLSGYSFKSDTYSIGIAALELATGEAPFAGLPVTEIMMLKLKGHPPILMRRPEVEQILSPFSRTFTKVVDLCVQPDPLHRPSPTKLLTMSFLKHRKKSNSFPSLNALLHPVAPLDTSQLSPNQECKDSIIQTLQSEMDHLHIQEHWA